MKEAIRVLILEDLPSDAELNEREVRAVLPGSEFLRVETRADFLAAMASFQPALILSDYSLPDFDGMSALQMAQEYLPDVPFILITGSVNEETAVACMKAGATDYVLKDHIKRLGTAVVSGVEQSRVRRRRREAEEALQDKMQELQRFHDVTVGRELAMIALKKEVNALLIAAGREARYVIVE
jgi:DNA-binding NtrC family response regulator